MITRPSIFIKLGIWEKPTYTLRPAVRRFEQFMTSIMKTLPPERQGSLSSWGACFTLERGHHPSTPLTHIYAHMWTTLKTYMVMYRTILESSQNGLTF